MGTNPLKKFFPVILFCLAVAKVQAQDTAPVVSTTPTVVVTPSVTPDAEKPLSLAGRFGIGSDSIRLDEDQLNTVSISINTISLTALDATYWLSNGSALDFLGAFSASDNPNFDFNGNTTNYPNQTWGIGLGYRQNLSTPIRDFRIQGLLRASYAQYKNDQLIWWNTQTGVGYDVQTQFSETILFSAGLGFEFFAPFCESLSLQSNLAYSISQNDGWVTQTFNAPLTPGYKNFTSTYSYVRSGLVLSGLSLSTLSVHFYF